MKRGVLTRMALALLVFGCVVLLGFGGAAPISIRLLAGYALKGTQIPVLNITDDDAVRRQASRFIDEVLGRAPLPMTVVDYPASLWPISQRCCSIRPLTALSHAAWPSCSGWSKTIRSQSFSATPRGRSSPPSTRRASTRATRTRRRRPRSPDPSGFSWATRAGPTGE